MLRVILLGLLVEIYAILVICCALSFCDLVGITEHKMKLIFLDIDGVLNSTAQFVVLGQRGANAEGIDPIALGLIKFICEKTGAKIVISSTWRFCATTFDAGFEKIAGMFEAKGWNRPPIIGQTPRGKTGHRGAEVNMFLEGRTDVERFICIDDSVDFFEDQNLVHIDDATGITIRDALQAITLLGLSDKSFTKEIDDLKSHTERRTVNEEQSNN